MTYAPSLQIRSWASMYKTVNCHIYAELLLKTFLGDKFRKNKI